MANCSASPIQAKYSNRALRLRAIEQYNWFVARNASPHRTLRTCIPNYQTRSNSADLTPHYKRVIRLFAVISKKNDRVYKSNMIAISNDSNP